MTTGLPPQLFVGRDPLGVRDVVAVAHGRSSISLDPHPETRARIEASVRVVQEHLRRKATVYGVTTGFGDSCDTSVAPEDALALQTNLVRYHGCGVGPLLHDHEVAAVMAVRLASLARGYSGVRQEVLERMCALLHARILPRIPAQGSVGASGDLTPLSYVAALLLGEREVSVGGTAMPAHRALAAAGLSPLQLAPKEALALMNGTSVMTALGCLVWHRALRLARFAAAITSMMVDVLRSNREHFDPRLDAAKPHPGQRRAAAWIRDDIEWNAGSAQAPARVQDRYSIRCAPHVIGVLVDACDVLERILDVEVNSVNDNPIVDVERGEFVHGGNFYGGHVAYALDALKPAVANVAGLVDRQLALLCIENTSNGLSANLVPPTQGGTHHGFKAMQITASAVTAQAMKSTMPASVFSRSTESHNQDIVSMGTHAAHDCRQVIEDAEIVAAIGLLAACQAVDLRRREGCHSRALALHRAVRDKVPMVEADRAQDLDVRSILQAFRDDGLPIGETQ